MEQHTLELSQTLNPNFRIERPSPPASRNLTSFELSMLCGAMVHPASSFSMSDEGDALSIEWVQEYPV